MPHIGAYLWIKSATINFFLLFNVVSRRCFFAKFKHGVSRRHANKRDTKVRSLSFQESISCGIWCVLLPRTIEQEQTYGVIRVIFEPIHRANLSHSRIPRLLRFASSCRATSNVRWNLDAATSSAAVAFAHTRWVEIVGAAVGLWIKTWFILYKSRFEDLA